VRILILSQWFDPEPTFKGLQFARSLQALGHDVEVLTGFPNYPGGKVYPGYQVRLFQRQIIDGIRILRVPLHPSHSSSVIGRALNYGSFGLSATIGILALPRADVVYVYHPPATAALPALVARLLQGVPFVYDVQDLWPESLAATGMSANRALLNAIDRGLRAIYRLAAHVVVLSEGFRTRLTARGVPEDKITVIPNWTYEHPPSAAREVDLPGEFTVVYAGNMGPAQALGTVLDAAARLQAEAPGVHFVLVGDGIDLARLTARRAQEGLPNVTFLPRQSTEEIEGVLKAADVLLVHLKDDPLFSITVPSKTQAYLRAGKAILMGVSGDAARLVEEAGAGISFAPEDADGLARAVVAMRAAGKTRLDEMGRSGARFYETRLSQAIGARRFADVFEKARLANPPGASVKRAFDVVVSGGAMIALALPILAVAALVALRIGRPVLFRQKRPGRHGKPFQILKFRTMTDARDAEGRPLPDAVRLTPFGAWLRSTSLDELPALWNVFKGDMSLVGPRPLLMRYLPYFSPEESLRHLVRPGVTGWAQVNGRNFVSWDRRLGLDVWYVRNWSLWLDLKIMALTALKVVRRQDFVADPESVMANLDDERRGAAGK
jgi:lipopolysaccharide/colanic/teichoic acid biosynthesis glycosyltransferase